MPARVAANDAGDPQEHVDEHHERRRDDERQPEHSLWLSSFHTPAIPPHPTAGTARRGRVTGHLCIGPLARTAGLAPSLRIS